MIDLTNIEEIKKLDPKDVYGSTGLFLAQCEQIWQDSKHLEIPDEYKNIDNIIVCGMGGSAYGAYVAQALLKDTSNVAIYNNNDYHLPKFANEKSLVILSSYSGSTEEVLSCGKQAVSKSIRVAGITNGGKLAEFLKANNSPVLLFNPQNNPSGQPRLGTGYMVLGFIALLNSLGVITITDQEITTAITELKNSQEEIKSKAISIAQKLQGYIPVILSAEFLNGNAHIMRNQFNETAKSFSAFEDLPELNHHLMEGLKNPADKKLMALFLSSSLYSDMLKKRIKLTVDVVQKNEVGVIEYVPSGTSQLSQMLNVLSFGGYVTLYLALLYGLDPSLIPWVDYFKDQLSKS